MAFCSSCGTKLNDGDTFCPACGTSTAQPQQTQQAQSQQTQTAQSTDFSEKMKNFTNTTDTTDAFEKDDIEKNKGMAIFSYLAILVLIPIFGAPTSKFARFHANQGLILLIIEIAWGICSAILTGIFTALFFSGLWGIFSLLTTILYLVNLVFLVVAIIGIINAVNGKAKELPIIGKFKILK
ncbi:MAG: zinc ribbon domain-containing protein [Oscillospiraceae bacterium]